MSFPSSFKAVHGGNESTSRAHGFVAPAPRRKRGIVFLIRRAMLSCWFAVYILFLGCLCGIPPVEATETIISRDTALACETLALINAERRKAGYSLLAEDGKLTAAAKIRLEELMRDYGKKRPGGDTLEDLLKKQGISFARAELSYVRGSASPGAAVAFFKKGRHASTNKDDYVRAGVAVGSDGNGQLYYAVIVVTLPEAVLFSGEYGAQKKRILNAINVERRKKGLRVLHYDPGLDTAAGIRAGELIGKYSGDRPDGSNALELFKQHAASLAGYSQSYGKTTFHPDAFAAGWAEKIAAPKALEEKYTGVGMGFAVSEGMLYWCMVFVEPKAFPAHADLESFRKEVLRLTNVERARHGLHTLKANAPLSEVANDRAGEIIRFYSGEHLRPDKSAWNTILAEYKFSWKTCGENIARGQKTPREVVTAWMNSPGHRANILNRTFTQLGVGARVSTGGEIYWSQNFISFK